MGPFRPGDGGRNIMDWITTAAGFSAVVCWSIAGEAVQPETMTVPADSDVAAGSAMHAPFGPGPIPVAPAPAVQPETRPVVTLPVGSPVFVMLDQDLSTMTAAIGDRFPVVVLNDVIDQDTVVIPKGTTGYGEVTFTTNKGSFGKPGIIGIALRHLQLADRQVALSGRYREEGQSKAGATAATYFAVGVFAGFIKGKPGVIPRGRELKARTGEAIVFTPGLAATLPPPPPAATLVVADAPDPTVSVAAEPAAALDPPAEEPGTLSKTGG